MPLRNPFARRLGGPLVGDPHGAPDEGPGSDASLAQHPGFERVDTVGSKASSVLSLGGARSRDTGEYKMSVVSDSGVYLPPSPTEEKGPWPQRHMSSRASTDTPSSLGGDIEHFSISRESFDSYRRSFDISARSPMAAHDVPARQSLDSARLARVPRPALGRNRLERQPPPTAEEGFEDVGLDDRPPPPRRSFFAKFADAQDHAIDASPVSRFLMPGRKRAHSGQCAELGAMDGGSQGR